MVENDNIMDDMQTLRFDDFDKALYIGTSSVIGKRREQQDAVLADDAISYIENGKAIAILCDGMGGMNGGGMASSLCASIVYKTFHSGAPFPSIPAFFRAAIAEADDAVRMMRDENGALISGAGTTLAAVVVDDNQLYWASVGDSRIYIIRGDECLCITKDHNYLMLLNEKVKRGELTQEEAESDPNKEALISYIGIGGVRYIDISSKGVSLLDGDMIVLCSDGFYRTVSEAELVDALFDFGEDTQETAEALTDLAISKDKRNQDNTSVIVLRYHESL